MARFTFLLCAALAATAVLAAGERPTRPEPSKRPEPSRRPTPSSGPGNRSPSPPPNFGIFGGLGGPTIPGLPDFGQLFGFNKTTVPPQLPADVKDTLEDLFRKAGKDNDNSAGARGGNGQPPKPPADDFADQLRKAAGDVIRAARNQSLLDPQGRPFVEITSPNGSFIIKTFNALNHARANLTTLLRVAEHWISLPAGENFLRGFRNDSILIVGASPRNRHGRGRHNHTIHSDVIDVTVTDGNGTEIVVNTNTTVNGNATVDITIVVNPPTDDGSNTSGGGTTTTDDKTCAWYDVANDVWSTEGCTSTPGDGFVDCSCNHLTSFALVTAESTPNTTPGNDSSSVNKAAIIGGVLGGVGFIALVVGAVIGVRHFHKSKKAAATRALVGRQYAPGTNPNSSMIVVVPSSGSNASARTMAGTVV